MERIKLCLDKNMNLDLINKATGLSKNLIKKYEELYEKYEVKKIGN